MERRRRLRGPWWATLVALVRLLVVTALLIGGYAGVRYVFWRSEVEVSALKNRPQPQYYAQTGKVHMVVVDDQGNKSMEISGQTLKLTKDQRTAIFTGAKADYYEAGLVSLHMEAGHIEYNMVTEDFTLTEGLHIETRDRMVVDADEVDWRRAKVPSGRGAQMPSFRFPKGVNVVSPEGNHLHADYMQADRELMYMEYVGHVGGDVQALEQTEFITERGLTKLEELKLKDFKKLKFEAEQVIYDKRSQVVLATSRFYDRPFVVRDFDGRIVRVPTYQKDPEQVTFSKEGITIRANHLEAHIGEKWVEGVGNIGMIVPASEPKEGDDKALRVAKQHEARIGCEDVEYFWGRDYIITHGRSRVEQEDRLAMADQVVYWGDQKMVLLDGNINVVQGSGQWMVENELIDVENHDLRRAVTAYTELSADRAVVYLDNNDFIASGNVRARQDERETFADTIVYQDTIKRLTAKGNVKFRDKDGQGFLCAALVYHHQTKFMEVSGGASATIRLPAKFANDINRAIARSREQEAPPGITDQPVPEPISHRNPNEGSAVARGVPPPPGSEEAANALGVPGRGQDFVGPLPPEGAEKVEGLKEAKELFIPLGKDDEKTKPEDGKDARPPAKKGAR